MELEDVTTAERFITFMGLIWEMKTAPHEGGGFVLLPPHPLYDRYHNAIKVANALGLEQSGCTKLNGQHARTFRFPSGDGVVISSDGAGVRRARRPTMGWIRA